MEQGDVAKGVIIGRKNILKIEPWGRKIGRVGARDQEQQVKRRQESIVLQSPHRESFTHGVTQSVNCHDRSDKENS